MGMVRKRRQCISREEAGIIGVIAGAWLARRATGTIHQQDPGAARVVGIVIRAQQRLDPHQQAGFFMRLAPCSLLGRLVGIGKTARQAPEPAPRFVAPPHQKHPPITLDERCTRYLRINEDDRATHWAHRAHPTKRLALHQNTRAARAVADGGALIGFGSSGHGIIASVRRACSKFASLADPRMKPQRIFIGLGSNLGDRVANLREAVRRLQPMIAVERVSNLYVAAPLGYVRHDAFINAVVQGTAATKPLELLAELQQIERAMGRRIGVEYGPRPIDLDILLFGSMQMQSLELTIPHPRLARRAFVLKPLAELAPNLMHPVLYYTVAQLLQDVDDADQVQLYQPPA